MENNNIHINIDLLVRFFADEVSTVEREQVLNWKEASTENKKQFEELWIVWQTMDKTSMQNEINIEAEWNHLLSTIDQKANHKTRSISLSGFLRIAAAIFIAFGLFYYGLNLISGNSVKTNSTETREIILSDGSRVTLNAGSKLSYKRNFGKELRVVSLQGEAFFEVKKNPDRPFIVQLGDAEIKVLGTSFNVKAYKNENKIEVTVAEGLVSLYDKNMEQKKVLAAKGEKAVFNKQQKIIKKQINEDRNYISWKTRIIVFDNENLANIASALENVYHKDIILQNSALNNCTVTTKFENKDLDTVLKVLKSTLDIHIEEKEGKIIISGEGC
jgi:transmembrane sensor